MANRQRNQHPPQGMLLGSLQVPKQRLTSAVQVPSRPLHTVDLRISTQNKQRYSAQFLRIQIKQVALIVHHVGRQKCSSGFPAQRLNIEGSPRTNMKEALSQLRRATA